MKHALALITILASLTSLNVTAAGQNNAPSADGRWIQVSRVCAVPGTTPWTMVPAQDAFVNGRDAMKLEVKGNAGILTTRIAGDKRKQELSIDQADQSITSGLNHQRIIYRLDDPDQMTIITGEFGEGGSCPVGAILFTTLQRY